MNILRSITRTKMLWITLILATTATILFAACGGSTQSQAAAPTATSVATDTPVPPTPTQGITATTQPSTTKPAQVFQVKIIETNGVYSFQPATISVSKGTQVVWTNSSDAPHTVTSDTNVFQTPSSLNQNDTFQTIFATPGTYTYHCTIHPYMKGKITVTA